MESDEFETLKTLKGKAERAESEESKESKEKPVEHNSFGDSGFWGLERLAMHCFKQMHMATGAWQFQGSKWDGQ